MVRFAFHEDIFAQGDATNKWPGVDINVFKTEQSSFRCFCTKKLKVQNWPMDFISVRKTHFLIITFCQPLKGFYLDAFLCSF